MRRCPVCRERLPEDPERRRARCPYCQAALYDDEPRGRRRSAVGQCAVHPANDAGATCPRCGNYACDVCRTPWRGRWLCAACVDLAMEANEAVPGEAAAHARQALLALALGALSWVVVVAGAVIAGAGVAGGSGGLIVLGGFVLLASPIPAVFGVGQGAAAVRTRGDHLILATLGLVLSGLNVGTFIGLITFSLSQN